ncbi:MAG: hypothetical protein ACOVSW_02425 [Candidatus Kapaibacteriota bacterium]
MEINLLTVLGALGITTIIGAFGLAHKYFAVLSERDYEANQLKKLELEIERQNTELRTKELELETKRLTFDIQALEQKSNFKKLE